MNQEWLEIINHYGYWLMFFGALIEGETFLIIGGIAASQDIFHLWGLIALASFGCLVHDGFFFYSGRYGGAKVLEKKPNWKPKVKKITRLLDKYDFWLIIAFRFAYGIRTVIPFALGISQISRLKFLIFDTIGAIIWSITFILGGYYFGNVLLNLLETFHLGEFFKKYFIEILLVISLIFSLISIYILRKRRTKKIKKNLKIKADADLLN